jgi:pimeloyl-ACP methyl ester carboxylesterase
MVQYIYMRAPDPERLLEIPIPGSNLHINARMRGSFEQPLAIVLHGLGGSSEATLPLAAREYFAQQGYATLGIDLYSHSPNTRDLRDCTLRTHADDFDTIVAFARAQGASTIVAAGHSYGGLAILRSAAVIEGAALWDPSDFAFSASMDREADSTAYVTLPEAGVRLYTTGAGYIVPLPMIAERIEHQHDSPELVKKDYPLLFVAAGKGSLKPYIEAYDAAANDPHTLHVIEDASHGLMDTPAISQNLLETTRAWFDQCVIR